MNRQSERTSGLPPYDDLPATVQPAFQGRAMLSAKELASLLEMDQDTLRGHIKNGDITGRTKGFGKVRRRWVFTMADVAKYLRRTDTVEERLQGSHHGHRQPSLHAVKEALAQRPLQRGTRNVYLRQRKRKAKPD